MGFFYWLFFICCGIIYINTQYKKEGFKKNMTLVELAKKWTNEDITDAKTKRLYEGVEVFEPYKEDNKFVLTIGDGNSWYEITEEIPDIEQRARFKKACGLFI